MELSESDLSALVVVAGAGACGAVAALAAAEAGAQVLVIEQDASVRGSTAMSQGLICAAGTRAQAAAGVEDSPTRFFDDIMSKTRGQTDPRLARAIADGAGPCLDWLIHRHGLPFELDIRFRAAYGHARARVHGWPGRGGDDLIQFLHRRLGETDVDVLYRARLVDVVSGPDGRVKEVVIERPSGAIEPIGCGALVLATSGFAANERMIARHMPELEQVYRHCHEGNAGVGLELGARLGGALADMGAYQGYAMLADPHNISLPPGQIVEGGILVNARGERFVDETADISGMLHAVTAQPGCRAWAIYDAEIEARCAYIPETQQLMALNAAKVADSLDQLASITGVPLDALSASIDAAHRARLAGRRDAFGRDWSGATPPRGVFRALKVRGALYHTQGGLQVDAAARVLRPDGSALPNLFAGGGAARGVSGPGAWGYLPAMGLCHAVTLGRIAGESAAALVQARSARS
jgi:fumarate reductase flavoprotein subunit